MKNAAKPLIALGLMLACWNGAAAEEAKDVPATDAQKKLLHGLTSLKYRVVFDPTNSVADVAKKSFAQSNLTMSEFAKGAESQPLKASEGRLTLVVDYRDSNKSWVGLTVNQLCRLERSAEPTWTGKTYDAGKLVARTKEKDAAKSLCDEFVAAFNKENPKK